MSAHVTRTRGVDADELEELVKAAREHLRQYMNIGDFTNKRGESYQSAEAHKAQNDLSAALKPFEQEEWR